MSSSERPRGRHGLVVAGIFALTALGPSGCQVRPLYAGYGTPETKLSSIAVDPVSTRVAQQVRNHLLFLLDRGGREPKNPAYTLALNVSSAQIGVFVGSSVDSSPTAGRDKITVAYVLKDARTGRTAKSGSRSAVAAFDLPPQEYTKLRAIRDAQDRAAVAAAELVHADLAGYLAR